MSCAQYQQLPADERDAIDYDFRRLASEKRYVRCPQCHHYIEHGGGCEHMRCRCGRPFTYNLYGPSGARVPWA
jgi:hypothetical protein